MEEITINESTEFVLVPRKEYDELTRARMGIDIIGSSFGKYGPNDNVVYCVCAQFGYKPKEDSDAE